MMVLAAACGRTSATPEAGSRPDSSRALVRTGNPYERGLTDADFPRVQQIARGVYTYEQLRSAGDEKFTTVSLFVVTADGVLVADGQGSVEETKRLVDTIAGITSAPITHVVIGSDHGDHTAGNSAFPSTATFIAHPTSAAVLAASASSPNRPADAPPVVVPNHLVADHETIRLGGREIEIFFLGRAHTGGDLEVYLPADKILFMSETFLNRIFPAMRSAYPSEWVEMLGKAQTMDVDVFVPGHGFVDPPAILKEELGTYRAAMASVIAEARRLHDAGVSADVAVQQAQFGELDAWTLRSSQGPIAIRRVYAELDGRLK
jgi:glyoxylase-like metal-dependent hydrolase (beta-lactamase superfamily II)